MSQRVWWSNRPSHFLKKGFFLSGVYYHSFKEYNFLMNSLKNLKPGHIFYDIYTGTWQKITSIEFVRGPLKRGKRVIGTYVWDVEIYLENGYLHQNIVYPGDFLYGSNVDSNFIPNMRIFNRQIGMPDYFLSPWTDLSFEEHCKIHIIKNHDICNCR